MAKPNPISIDELSNEYLPTIVSGSRSKTCLFQSKQVLKIIADMGIVHTNELILTSEFLDRFLSTWGGSIRRDSIRQILTILGKVRDHAARHGYLDRSESGRPVALPPEWDDRDQRFAQANRVLSAHYQHLPEAEPTWDQFVALVGHLKRDTRAWLGARRFMMVALVVLGRVKATDAATLELTDVDRAGPDRKIRIGRRGRREILVSGPLETLVDRWLPRAGPKHLFPNQSRTGPWRIDGSRTTVGSLNGELSDACQEAKLPTVRIKDLRRIAKANIARLADESESPFRTEAGDGVLLSEPIPIARLRDFVMGHYRDSKTRLSERMAEYVFEIIAAMPEIKTTRDMESRDFVARFSAKADLAHPGLKPKNCLVDQLQVITNICNDLGYIDSNPLPCYKWCMALKWERRTPVHRRVTDAVLLQAPAPDQVATISQAGRPDSDDQLREPSRWDDWDASVCPVHIREDGHLVVFGQVKGRLRFKSTIQLVQGLMERFPNGFDYPGLIKRFGPSAVSRFVRLKERVGDCRAAFQTPGVKGGGLYKIGPPDD